MFRLFPLIALLGIACAPPAAGAAPKHPSKTKAGANAKPQKADVGGASISAATASRVKKIWEAAAGGAGRAVALSSKLGRVAFISRETIELFDLRTGKSVASGNKCKDAVHAGAAFVGTNLVVICEKSVLVLDPKTLAAKPPPNVNASRATAGAIVGTRLVIGHRDGVIRIYSLDGSSAPIEIRVPGPPIDVKSVALSRDGARLAVAWVQGSIWWWETAKTSEFHDLVRHDKESDALAFSDDGSILAEEGMPNETTLWSFASSPTEKGKVHNGNWVKRIAFTRDGKWLVRGGSDGLELAEIGGPKRVALDTRSPVEDVALDELGATIAAVDRDGRLTVWAVR